MQATPLGWKLYGALVRAASLLHYAVLSPLGRSDEGGMAWLRRRLATEFPGPLPGEATRIWIHAVSAGESKVAELLRRQLLGRDPSLSIVLSATTYSGFARAEALAGAGNSFVLPLDTLDVQQRLFERLQPDLMVLVESEFWPAQFAAARMAGVPVCVVNATMSERSFARHRRWPAVADRTLRLASRIYAQDEAIATRYRALGVGAERVVVTGNLKLAAAVPDAAGDRPPLVLFGNVHREELELLGPVVRRLRAERPGLGIWLVPRYPGRVPPEMLMAAFGTELRVVGTLGGAAPQGLCWIDSMGVLREAYRQCRVGIVCGTFARLGGHDLSEPLQQGAASLYGPDVSRQRALHAALAAHAAAGQVLAASDLPGAVAALLDDPGETARRLARYRALAEAANAGLERIGGELLDLARAHSAGRKPSAR